MTVRDTTLAEAERWCWLRERLAAGGYTWGELPHCLWAIAHCEDTRLVTAQELERAVDQAIADHARIPALSHSVRQHDPL